MISTTSIIRIYVDFEYFGHQDEFNQMMDYSNLVLSYHNFQETPENMMDDYVRVNQLYTEIG